MANVLVSLNVNSGYFTFFSQLASDMLLGREYVLYLVERTIGLARVH
jgi:hypothetical protein